MDDFGVSLETAQRALENIVWAKEVWGQRVFDPFVFLKNIPSPLEVKKEISQGQYNVVS